MSKKAIAVLLVAFATAGIARALIGSPPGPSYPFHPRR
jgi:hypothetical protein